MSKYLFDKLREDTSIEHVLFDEKGGFSLMPSNSHPIKKTREEVLAGEESWKEANAVEDDGSVDVTEYLEKLEKENQEIKEDFDQLKLENGTLKQSVTDLTAQLVAAKKKNKTENKPAE